MTKNTIHHATLAAAAKLGFVLESTEDGVRVTSKKPAFSFDVQGKAKDVLLDAQAYRMIATEYDKVVVSYEDGQWLLSVEEGDLAADGERLQEAFEALIDAAQNAGVEIESEEVVSVVVPAKYKAQYAEAGHPQHCGDWLATYIDGRFDTVEGKLDEAAFTAFLVENKVELTGKWAELPTSGQKGWEGRYRMNGCQKVRVNMARTGILYLGGEAIPVPQEDLAILWAKHPSAYTDYDTAKNGTKAEKAEKAEAKAKPAKAKKTKKTEAALAA